MKPILTTITLLLAFWIGTAAQEADVNRLVDGVRQGRWRIEGRNGKVDEGLYVDGKKHGEWVTMSAAGVPRSRVTFNNGVAIGRAVYYFEDGSVMEEGFWNVDHWEGSYQRFYANGNKSCSFNYDNTGRRVGKQSYYHENGKIMFDGEWVAGKVSGALSIYNEDGVKVMERNYDNSGKYQGSQQVDVAEAATAGKREFTGTGAYTLYDAAGRRERTGKFIKGVLINGEKFHYDESSKLIKIDVVKDGKVTATRTP